MKKPQDSTIPTRIEVKQQGQVANVVPGHVWRVKPFKWNPATFMPDSEQLNSRFIEPIKQDQSLMTFLDDPTVPMIMGISGSPDDSKAKYMAAFLVDMHVKRLKSQANPWWAPLYGGFDNPYLNVDKSPPTMLVITNLTNNSTNVKLEKARDLIEAYPDIPRLVVIAGIDPISFLAAKLHVPINGLIYLSEGLLKQRVEVI